ncbi:MAG: hypothetical protein ACOH14_02480 [Rhodoglobus sp.]
MSAVIEYVRFEVKNIEELTQSRDALVSRLREVYGEGLLSAQLGLFDDGTAVDVVVWASREVANRAAAEMPSDPAVAPFFSQIGAVHEMRHAKVLHSS